MSARTYCHGEGCRRYASISAAGYCPTHEQMLKNRAEMKALEGAQVKHYERALRDAHLRIERLEQQLDDTHRQLFEVQEARVADVRELAQRATVINNYTNNILVYNEQFAHKTLTSFADSVRGLLFQHTPGTMGVRQIADAIAEIGNQRTDDEQTILLANSVADIVDLPDMLSPDDVDAEARAIIHDGVEETARKLVRADESAELEDVLARASGNVDKILGYAREVEDKK